MELIFASALCSVLVSILLKTRQSKGDDVWQMLLCNYAVASALCWLWFQPDLAHISVQNTPWWLIILLGILLPSVFLLLSQSLKHAGLIKTEVAQRLSVVLSLLAAYVLFQEQFSTLKCIGMGIGISAVALMLWGKVQHSQPTGSVKRASTYLLLVWSGYAVIDILLKYCSSLGVQFAVSLNLMFICAFVVSLLVVLVRKSVWHWHNAIAGLVLGLLNFANIALYVKAHMLLKDSPAIVFAGMNILVVVFGLLAGRWLFKEKMSGSTMLGMLLAMFGIACLAWAM